MSHELFNKLAEEMELYRTKADMELGLVIGIAATAYGLESAEAGLVVRALHTVGKTHERALFGDVVSQQLVTSFAGDPATMLDTLDRIATFLSMCGSIKEFDAIVSKSAHIPPTQNN